MRKTRNSGQDTLEEGHWALTDFRKIDYRQEVRHGRPGAPKRRKQAPSSITPPLLQAVDVSNPIITNEEEEGKDVVYKNETHLADSEAVSQLLHLEPVNDNLQHLVSSSSASSNPPSSSSPTRNGTEDIASTLPRSKRVDISTETLSSSAILQQKSDIDLPLIPSSLFTPLTTLSDTLPAQADAPPLLKKKLRRSERTGWLHLLNSENFSSSTVQPEAADKASALETIARSVGKDGGSRASNAFITDETTANVDLGMKGDDETSMKHASPIRSSGVLLPRAIIFQSPVNVSSSSSSLSSSFLLPLPLPQSLLSFPSLPLASLLTQVENSELQQHHQHHVDIDVEPTSLVGLEEAPSTCIICCDDFVSEEGIEKETVKMECCDGIICLSCISKVVQLRSNRKTCALCQFPLSEEVMADILGRKKQAKNAKKEARRLMLMSINEGTEDILAARRVAEAMASVEKKK